MAEIPEDGILVRVMTEPPMTLDDVIDVLDAMPTSAGGDFYDKPQEVLRDWFGDRVKTYQCECGAIQEKSTLGCNDCGKKS